MHALTSLLLTPFWMERGGLVLVALALLSLVTAYQQVDDGLTLSPLLTSLALGAFAVGTGYWLVRVTLTDCAPIALATAAGLAVLPGHLAAITSDSRVLLTEIFVGLSLIAMVYLSRKGTSDRPGMPFTIGLPQLAAFIGTVVITFAITTLSAALGIGESMVDEAIGAQETGFLGLVRSATGTVEIFWLGLRWAGLIPGLFLVPVTIVVVLGAGRYATATARDDSELIGSERVGVTALYLALFSVGVAAVVFWASVGTPGPVFFYAAAAPLVLLGIIGFEQWFPPASRPLVVLGLLAMLFGFNLWRLAA